MGQNNFIQLTLRTTKVKYEFFGIDDPVELMESDTVSSGNLTKEELLTLDMIMGVTPKLTTGTENSGTLEVQPTNVLMVKAEVHASFDYSPHRKHYIEEKTSQSNNNTIECAKKVDDKWKPTPQNKKDNDNIKKGDVIGKMGKVLSKKSSPLVDERPKKQHIVSDYTIEDNTAINTELLSEKLSSNNEEEMDSDSTIVYDFSENSLKNKTETLPKVTSISESKIPIAGPMATKTKKTTKNTQENKALGLNPRKSGRRVSEKTTITNKEAKQGVHKTTFQQTTNITTQKKGKISTRKDIPSGSLPKFTYSSYKLSCSKKKEIHFPLSNHRM